MLDQQRTKNPSFTELTDVVARLGRHADSAGAFDLKRYSIWVTVACLWGLALTASLFAAVPALRISGLNPGPTYVLSAGTVLIGLAISVLPWPRWGSDAILVMGIVSVPSLAVFNHLTNYSQSDIGLGVIVAEYFCTTAICGLTQRRGVPVVYGLYSGAVLVTSALLTNDPRVLVVGPIILFPFTSIIGETIAWTVGALRDARRREVERIDDLQTLSRSLARLRADIPVDDAADIVVATARQLLHGSHAQLILRDEPRARLVGEDGVNETMEAAMSANELRTHRCVDAGFDTLFVPLAHQRTPWGVIVVWLDRPLDDFTSSLAGLLKLEAETALEQLHTIAALALDATIDTLTGIGNRRMADAAIAELATRDAVLLIDLDKFKAVNDTYGHAAGDAVLRGLAACLSAGRRDGDVVARLGGDELVWIAKGADDQARAMAEKLRARWIATTPRSTVSIGVAVHSTALAPADTLGHADVALYVAKDAGGDRVELYAPLHLAGSREAG